jgi:hypothetical protein
MNSDEIDDKRDISAFKSITFSKYQKSKVKEKLINSIYNNKIESACYWSAEFICSGHLLELWEIIILYFCKYIHNGNPKLIMYLEMRYNNFATIINNGYSSNILLLRNNLKIRKLFCEIICILTFSNKKHAYKEIKIDKNTEYDLTNLTDKFKASSIDYIKKIYLENDPKELFIPLNEFVYNLEIKNIVETCYWYEWVLNYEIILKKNKIKCIAEGRSYAPKDHYNDIIWIIWDIFFYYSSKDIHKKKIINALFTLFTIRYNPCMKRKRKYIIYFAINILIEKIDFTNQIIEKTNNEKLIKVLSNINIIYKQIKKNEESPNTDYMFKNLKKSNIEKTMEKMDIMDNFNNLNDNDNDNDNDNNNIKDNDNNNDNDDIL